MDDKENLTSANVVKKEFSGSFLKGFAAGVILSHISKNLIVGLLVGTLGGCYVQQNYEGIPNVSETLKEWHHKVREAMKKTT